VNNSKNSKKSKRLISLIITASLTLAVLFIYRLFLVPDTPLYRYYPYVMWGYMIILTVFVLVYIFYNRAFSRNGVTVEMLPNEWSDEKKNEFIASGERRKQKSKWMLMVIIAFLTTFLVDAIELFVIPLFDGLFK
jgi:hypothetical protein